jgi:cell division protein FtsB
MSEFDLNLSTQPFPAYRLINIALACVLAVLAVVSVWQGIGFARYSKMARSIQAEERETRIEAEALGKRVSELESRLDRPESAAKLNEIGFLNHLILRKSLSWTRLFAVLEDLVSDNVHFTTLAPDVGADGAITLRLGVQARNMADIKAFLVRVEKSPLFENLNVAVEEKVEEEKDSAASKDVEVTLSTVYTPQKETR